MMRGGVEFWRKSRQLLFPYTNCTPPHETLPKNTFKFGIIHILFFFFGESSFPLLLCSPLAPDPFHPSSCMMLWPPLTKIDEKRKRKKILFFFPPPPRVKCTHVAEEKKEKGNRAPCLFFENFILHEEWKNGVFFRNWLWTSSEKISENIFLLSSEEIISQVKMEQNKALKFTSQKQKKQKQSSPAEKK